MGVTARGRLWAVLAAVVTLAACGGQDPAPRRTFPASPAAPVQNAPSKPASPPPPASDKPKLVEIGEFDEPTFVTSPPGDPRLFVVEKGGRVKIVGQPEPKIFLDISDQVSTGSERGLFSIAFAPDHAMSGLVYVSYTDNSGDSRVVEYRVEEADPNRIDVNARREILSVKQPFANHNGGLILFDSSQMLLIGLGDGGGAGDPGNRAQDLDTLLGKLLRIDPANPGTGKPYGIPEDNPFVGRSGARPEIWAYGLRNPWRFSFDPTTKDLYLADVGQNRLEEINFVPPRAQPGANFGWRKYEGDRTFKRQEIDESRLVRPVLTYPLSGGACAVTGGGIYRGEVESLKNFYLYADYCEGEIKGFRIAGGKAVQHTNFEGMRTDSLSSFGEDAAGQMYVTSLDGKVYRIAKA